MNDSKNEINELRDIMKMLDEHKAIPLSNFDIERLVEGKASIVLYRNIHKAGQIEELFQGQNACVILYESSPRNGHWVCLTIRHRAANKKPELEFFDPYGGFPDTQLQHIPKEFAKESFQDVPYLTTLLYDADDRFALSYNEFQFQELKSGISDCGRWVSVRILLKDLTLKQFKSLFFTVYSDDLVTFLTMPESEIKDFEYTEKSTIVK